MRFIGEDGSPAASFPASAPGEIDGPTAELEILRGELSRILLEHTREHTDYRFGTQIADLTDHGDHVTVALRRRNDLDADVVVIAEGLRSRTPVRHPRPRSPTSACTSPTSRSPAGRRRPVVELAARPRLPRRAPAPGQPRHHPRHPDVHLRRARTRGPRPRRPGRHSAPHLRRRRRRRSARPRRAR